MPIAFSSNTVRRTAETDAGRTERMSEQMTGRDGSRVLLFGATGATGRVLLHRLDASGIGVDALTRSDAQAHRFCAPQVFWHRGALPDWPLLSRDITHIICLGPGDVFVEWLARQAAPPGLRQIIAFGSTSADSKIDSSCAPERDLAVRLRSAQSLLAEHGTRLGVPWTLLRPTLIYGGGDDSVARIGRWIRRRRVYPLLIGRGALARRQPVHARDLAQAVCACIDQRSAFNRSFDLPGGECLSLRALIQRISRACGRLPLPLPIPLFAALHVLGRLDLIPAHAALQVSGLGRLERDQLFDGTPAAAALGYAPGPFMPDSAEW